MANTREIAKEYRLSHWAQIMQDRSASGMSIKAYCESKGIPQNNYFYWQRKLREAAITAAANTETSPVPAGWAICEAKPASTNEKSVEIEIGKSRITAYADTDLELLAKVCRTLVSLC